MATSWSYSKTPTPLKHFASSASGSRSTAGFCASRKFRAGLSTLLDPEAIQTCTAIDRRELPPVSDLNYSAFVDPSGGRRDAFTVGIGHRDDERAVVDVVRAWPAPFNPAAVTEECAALLRTYRVSRVTGDRYAGEWPREQFRSHGITYNVADRNRSELYLSLVAFVNGARVEIPDDPALLRELRGLERRRGPSGKDRVDHVPGARDDRANALAGVAHLLLSRASGPSWDECLRAMEYEGDEISSGPVGATSPQHGFTIDTRG